MSSWQHAANLRICDDWSNSAGGNFFEPGYPVGKRFLNLGYKVSQMTCDVAGTMFI
jgi:hypothetical protein